MFGAIQIVILNFLLIRVRPQKQRKRRQKHVHFKESKSLRMLGGSKIIEGQMTYILSSQESIKVRDECKLDKEAQMLVLRGSSDHWWLKEWMNEWMKERKKAAKWNQLLSNISTSTGPRLHLGDDNNTDENNSAFGQFIERRCGNYGRWRDKDLHPGLLCSRWQGLLLTWECHLRLSHWLLNQIENNGYERRHITHKRMQLKSKAIDQIEESPK